MAVLLVVLFAVLPDPVGIWREQIELAWASMAKAGLQFEGDRDVIIAAWARTMWGGLAVLSLGTVFGAVLLGRWWQSLLDTPGSFGVEYRELRLGRALGIATTVLFIVALADRLGAGGFAGLGGVRRTGLSGPRRRPSQQGGRPAGSQLAGGDLCIADRAAGDLVRGADARDLGLCG